jgi:hypothetical protein
MVTKARLKMMTPRYDMITSLGLNIIGKTLGMVTQGEETKLSMD